MRGPPDPNCADKPYETMVEVIVVGNPRSTLFTTANTDKEGRYKIMLPPGDYALQAVRRNPLPGCGTINITVKPGIIGETDIMCDIGIR